MSITVSEMRALLRLIERQSISNRSLDISGRRREILVHALRAAIERWGKEL